MIQVWDEKGKVRPATIVQAGPCYVTQVKTKEKDGYAAVQLGFGTRRKLTKAMRGHLQGVPAVRWLREFKMENEKFKIGDKEVKREDVLDVNMFAPGDLVKITGVSKGKGFQGVVKRHGFHGSPKTHGHKDQLRMPGSIGAGGVQHVRKGQRMAGRMGGERVTIPKLKILQVDKDKNQLVIQGAIPGPRGGQVMIVGD